MRVMLSFSACKEREAGNCIDWEVTGSHLQEFSKNRLGKHLSNNANVIASAC